jgi:hypothetical protein
MPESAMLSVRGGKREHVDPAAQRTDALLVLHPETMFLVHHEEAQRAELDVLLEQPVGPDDDVELTLLEAPQRLAVLRSGAEAREHVDAHGIALEARAKRLEMLRRQDGRGDEHGHLLPGQHGQERSAHRHLGLAEADVAAHQPIHRPRAAEVGDDLLDGALLARGFLKGEARRELLVEPVGGFVRRAVVRLARGIDFHQVVRHGEDGLLGLRLDALPRRAAELVERGRRTIGTDVALHHVDAIDGHVEAIAAQVLEVQEVPLGPRHLHVLQAAVCADAVVDVHHVVVGL